MELEQRVDVLEDKITTMQMKQAAQDVSNAHTAALLEKFSRALDKLIESNLLNRPPIEPILLELNTNIAKLAQQNEPVQSKKNSIGFIEFLIANAKTISGIGAAVIAFFVWLIHHIVFVK